MSTYSELQSNLSRATQELQLTTQKLGQRSRDGQLSALTLKALTEVPDDTRVHTQLGKAFITRPLDSVKQQLQKREEDCRREATSLASKKTSLEGRVKQIEQETQEFIQAHLKPSEAGASSQPAA